MNLKRMIIFSAWAIATLSAAALAQPSTSQIDNGFTGGKLFALPGDQDDTPILDQVVIDSGYGGSDKNWPDVFTLHPEPDRRSVVIKVNTIDRDAIDFGRVAKSAKLRLPGMPVAMASAPAAGYEARFKFGSTYPPLWIAYSGTEARGVAVVNSRKFSVIGNYNLDRAEPRALVVVDTPLTDADTKALEPAFPDVIVAVDHAGRNELRIFSSRSGELLNTYDAPAGRITAVAAGRMNAKSKAVGVNEAYPWIVLAVQTPDASTLTLINTQDGGQNGGPLAPLPGRVTGISIADTAVGGLDADRPEIYVSYVTETGDNAIAVYNTQSNVLVITYPPRTPRGTLVGFHVQRTDLDLGIGGEGYATLFYAIANPIADKDKP